jgi:hypothetical protein
MKTTTFVTAFFKPATSYRNEADYFTLFNRLANTGISILLFLDTTYTDKVFPPNVRVIPIDLDTSFLPETPVLPSHMHPIKDNAQYMCIQLNKFRVMNEALAYTETPYLAWIDFGVFHMIQDENRVMKMLHTIERSTFRRDRIVSPGSKKTDLTDVWTHPVWRLFGTFWVGHRTLIPLAYIRQLSLVMENLPKLTWEVNYWAMMDEFFDIYTSGHDDSIFTNIPLYGEGELLKAIEWHKDCLTARVLHNHFHHFIQLYDAVGRGHIHGWGSYLFDGLKYSYQLQTLKKQEALFRVGQKASHLLEIGVYLGHSLLILLISNPTLRITCIDNDARYSPKAVEYLNQHFGNRITFHLGDASEVLKTLPFDEYDAIHIDADHTHEAVRSHFVHSLPLAKKNALVIFDDYEATQSLIDKFITDKVLTIVELPKCLWTNIVTQLNV